MGVLDIFSGLAAPVVDYFKQRATLKSQERVQQLQIDAALHQRQLELISQGLTADLNWEMEFAKQAASSWKDEYTLLVVSVPAILCFLGHRGSQLVADGFDALGKCPTWYQVMFCSIFLATYGIRWWRRTQSDT